MPRPSGWDRSGTMDCVCWRAWHAVASARQRGGEPGGRVIALIAHGGLVQPGHRGGAARHPRLPCGDGGPDDQQAQAEGRRRPGRSGWRSAHDGGGGVRDGQHPRRRQHQAGQRGRVLQQQVSVGQDEGCQAEQPVGVDAGGQQQQRFPPPHPAPPPDQPDNANQFQDPSGVGARNSSGLSWIPPPWYWYSTWLEPCRNPQPR